MLEDTKKTGFMQKTPVVWGGALICCLLWGSAFPCVKIGYRLFAVAADDSAAQILFAGLRFTLAGILAILIGSLLSRRLLLPKREAAGGIAILCLLQTVIQYFFFYIGLAHTSGVKASIIEAVSVFVAILVASFLFHQESLTLAKIGGCIIGFAGVVLINARGVETGFALNGEGFLFLSTVSYAFSSVYLKRLSQRFDPVMLSGWQFVFGGLIMTGAGFLMGGRLQMVSGGAVPMLLYLAFISAAAYSLWGILLKYNPVSRVAVFGFMNPVFGVLLSALLLGEKEQAGGLISILSLILVSTGIWIVNRGKEPGRES